MSHCRSQLWWIAQTICLGGRLAWATPGQDTSWLAQSLTGLGHCCCPPGAGHRLAGWRHGTHGSRQMDGWTGGSLAWVRAGQTHCGGQDLSDGGPAVLGHSRSPNWWRAQAGWMDGWQAWVTAGRASDPEHRLAEWMPCKSGHCWSLQVKCLVEGTC